MSKYAFIPDTPESKTINLKFRVEFFEGSVILFADNKVLVELKIDDEGSIQIAGLNERRSLILLSSFSRRLDGKGWKIDE